jgi:phosphoserine aminotransferase
MMNTLSPTQLNALNFSGGPGALPETVLEQVREAIVAVPGVGLSVLGISHRSDWFASVVEELESNIRELLGLRTGYRVLFLQGGATQQFSMVPMSLLRGSPVAAQYLHTGYWSGKALPEARREGPVQVAWSGEASGFTHLPTDDEIALGTGAPYLHYVSNETVEGLQFHRVVGRDDVPRICDMSSDFLSRPGEFDRYALIYAHAQKNIGPAGVTVVVLRDELLQRMHNDVPAFLDYRAQADANSVLNTPPVFAIYVILLVTRWLRDMAGGLEGIAATNAAKAEVVYAALDASKGFYRGRAAREDRSLMNVVFNLPSADIEERFLADAAEAGFSGLNGHRSVGGIRASIYNGLELAAAEKLANFMNDFARRNR